MSLQQNFSTNKVKICEHLKAVTFDLNFTGSHTEKKVVLHYLYFDRQKIYLFEKQRKYYEITTQISFAFSIKVATMLA